MDPVTPLVGGYLVSKLFDHFVDCFKISVIERWSRWRAERFFESFCQEIERYYQESSAINSKEIESRIKKILDNDDYSEILFESYRSVCLSRSKNIGPRIIGVLTAKIITEDRTANSWEELIFAAAEELNDEELREFVSFVQEYRKKVGKKVNNYTPESSLDNEGNLRIRWRGEQLDSNYWGNEQKISVSNINLQQELGLWAVKLKNLGIISDEITERHWRYTEDSERHIDEDGEVREITFWLTIEKPFFFLAELIEQLDYEVEDANISVLNT